MSRPKHLNDLSNMQMAQVIRQKLPAESYLAIIFKNGEQGSSLIASVILLVSLRYTFLNPILQGVVHASVDRKSLLHGSCNILLHA